MEKLAMMNNQIIVLQQAPHSWGFLFVKIINARYLYV